MAESIQAAPLEDRARPNPFARVFEEQIDEAALAYVPSDDERAIAGMVEDKFREWRQIRQQQEPQWYINAAMFRGNHDVRWSPLDNRLISSTSILPQRTRRQINRIFAKVRARRAKFLKNRPTWIVIPASTDVDDKLNARLTGKVLDYLWRKLRLELKFRDAIVWSETCSRGYWWFGWDPDVVGRIRYQDPMTGEESIQEAVIGDVTVEVGSPFEVLVGDPAASSLTYQSEIIRAKERTLDYIRSRYPERGMAVQAEGAGDLYQYERQISGLSPVSDPFGGGLASTDRSRHRNLQGDYDTAVVKEYFHRPDALHPKGKYCVVAGGILLKQQDELPFGFWDMENPFPAVEFVDIISAGQYWGPTLIEQLIDVQREYNGVRSMVATNIKLMGHPKVFVATQHQIAPGAWTPDAGEMIEYTARPGIDKPFVWTPPNITGDAWRVIELIQREFDDITQIYPSTEGKAAGTESGFHANLLQEASDLVHTPDARSHELAVEEAAFKIRRILKQGYDIPRLITVTSSSYQPEVFEFSADQVDDHADIIVQAGSSLPVLKGARIQAALDLYARGVMGDPADPEVRRRLLNVLDLGGMEDIYEQNRIDEDMINIENSMAEDGMPLSQPRFYEDHTKHWAGHINKLKSPAVMHWPTEARMGLLAHAILHAKYINHAAAYQMSIEAGLEGLIEPPPPMLMPPGVMPPGPAGPGTASPPAATGPPSPDVSFGEAPDLTSASGTPDAAGGLG